MCYKGRPTTICSACDYNDGEILYFCEELIDNNIRRKRSTRGYRRDPQNMISESHDTMNLIPELRATRAKKNTKMVP